MIRRWPSSSAARACISAFTLIELMAVLAIIALLSTAAVLTFAAPLGRARTADAIASVRSVDAYTRQSAVRFNRPSQILIDLDAQTITRTSADALYLPTTLRVTEVRLPARRHTTGQVRIPCTAAGFTPTYALHLTGPD